MNFAHLLLLTDAQQSEKGDFADSPQRKARALPQKPAAPPREGNPAVPPSFLCCPRRAS